MVLKHFCFALSCWRAHFWNVVELVGVNSSQHTPGFIFQNPMRHFVIEIFFLRTFFFFFTKQIPELILIFFTLEDAFKNNIDSTLLYIWINSGCATAMETIKNNNKSVT